MQRGNEEGLRRLAATEVMGWASGEVASFLVPPRYCQRPFVTSPKIFCMFSRLFSSQLMMCRLPRCTFMAGMPFYEWDLVSHGDSWAVSSLEWAAHAACLMQIFGVLSHNRCDRNLTRYLLAAIILCGRATCFRSCAHLPFFRWHQC